MKLKIEIKMDSAAFTGDSGTEVARLLRAFATRIEGEHMTPGRISFPNDCNGNRVGSATVTGRAS